MKIAFIVSSFPSISETFILNQITGLIDLGHDIEIFAQNKPECKKMHPDIERYELMKRVHYYIKIPKNKTHRVLKALYYLITNMRFSSLKMIFNSLNFFKYKREALSLKLFYMIIPFLNKYFDILHCHFGPNGILGSQLKEIGLGGKLITTFHGYDVNSYPKLMGEDVYKFLFENGDLFTTNTNYTRDKAIQLGCNGKKILILPVGFKMDKFKFLIKESQNIEKIKVLTIGRLVEKKGHKFAIEAIAKVIKKYNNIIYIIAGAGPLREELESLTLKLKIAQYINFLGAVEQNEVLKLYNKAHIFILPSVTASNGDKEGQALVIQEAQSCGLPVISTWHNGIPEGLMDGKSGFLVPERDSDALAEKLIYLIEHPEIWPEMGKCGRRFVEEKYDIKKLNEQLENIYQDLIDGKYE